MPNKTGLNFDQDFKVVTYKNHGFLQIVLLSGFVKVVDKKKTKKTKETKKTKPHNAVRPENSIRP